ncbi:GNAT family N-acetyltransferase [Acinetobacter sp. WCHA45]|uniref:GNAT family N-acetyltransferase n=1 Tax=Acinetobacter sp. WCHA45 TaxID=2004644 RepID=UPI000B3C7EE7|nr:GNAT family N-acetyltransferase [Acinetobacter sp. WCHA45]AVZ84742.1 N-acetyltransferase [Acinetobacter sp. WCHA45]
MNLSLKTIRLRFVEELDAEFILKLRLDSRYNKFLSNVSDDIQVQRDWIKKYKVDEGNKEQFYFIIERLDGVPCGTVRIYDLKEDSFCWGSWILNEDKTPYSAWECSYLIYKFGFEVLKCNKSHFNVMKGNEGVINFHKKMGAIEMYEDEKNLFFMITQQDVTQYFNKVIKIII